MTSGACLRRGVQNARENREHTEPETRNGVPGLATTAHGVIERGEGGTEVPQRRRESSNLARERISRIRGRSWALWWNAGSRNSDCGLSRGDRGSDRCDAAKCGGSRGLCGRGGGA